MKRRTVLQFAGVGTATALAGCLDGISDHFGFQGNVPIEITNEGSEPYNITLEAVEQGSGRESYDESITVTPGERAAPSHLQRTEQQFRVSRIENEEVATVETAEITSDTEFVRIRLYDDRIELDVQEAGDEDANESEADDGNATGDDANASSEESG